MDGGSRVAEVLRRHGVQFVFTLIGGHISPILVGAKRAGIRVIDVRHEVNTVFAADAVARLTGVPGIAVVTAGPGVSNTITAIKNAQMAQSPLILIGGATATMLRGRGSLQDIDQLAMIRPHVKQAFRCNRLKEVVPALEEAFRISQEGVPGPVFVELAVDLLYKEEIVREWYAKAVDKPDKNIAEQATSLYVRGHLHWVFGRSRNPEFQDPAPVVPPVASGARIHRACELISTAKKPVLVVGSQAMLRTRRTEELVHAIETLGIPVFLSGMARGLLGKDHPLQLRHKRTQALKGADVVVLAGVPADFRLDYGNHVARAKVVGINLCAEDLNKNRRPDVGLQADPHASLVTLSRKLGQRSWPEWLAELRARHDAREEEIDQQAQDPVKDPDGPQINPIELCRAFDAQLSENSILVGDGGDFVATASYTVQPRGPLRWLDPGVFGTLGVGAGFALGAKLVRPDADVWLLYGDGAAGFSIAEFDTFVRHGVNVIALVGNDGCWTQIERDQVPILGDDVACKLNFSDYQDVAKGFGAKGFKLTSPRQIDQTLKKAVAASKDHPVLVNAHIGQTDFRKGSISM